MKSCPTGSAAKKGKRYVYADILGFLDKVVTRRNHEGNYEADNNDELSVRDTETMEDGHEEQTDIRTQRALEDTKNEKESEPKKKKPQDVPGEILNILKMKKNTATKDYDDDEKYLLSFSGDMKKMKHLQKIDFKLGMMQLLKNIFKENSNISSPYYINSSTPSPQSSCSPIYQEVSRSRSAQSRYTGTPSTAPQTIITIPRPSARPQGVLYNTDPTSRVVINSVETISSGGQSNAHGDYYEYNRPTGSTSQTEEIITYDECKTQLNNYLSFK